VTAPAQDTADAVEAPTEAPADDAPAAGVTGLASLLTPEGFDADQVLEMINGSDLSAVQKTALSAAVNGAKDNPELLEATLTRIKEAMGM